MLLSSARAIPETPTASAAVTKVLFTIENFLFMTAPYLKGKGVTPA
jgi:hypothetical protein